MYVYTHMYVQQSVAMGTSSDQILVSKSHPYWKEPWKMADPGVEQGK